MKPLDYIAPLSASPLGVSLGSETIRDMLTGGDLHHFPKDAVIFQEGDSASGIWLVLEGVVKLSRYTLDGREVILHLAEPFLIIAEAALFLGRYPASATVTGDATLLYVQKELLFTLMERHPTFQRRLFNLMSGWMKLLVDKIDQLTMNDATARVVRYLLSLATDPKRPELRLPMKKGELAVMLNMNQATLSRTLRKLQDDGLILVSARTIKLLKLAELKRLSAPPLF